jgi:DNA polymerase-3 subunit gamma/tau
LPGEERSYLVIARKWRPSTFDEVIGQEHVTRTLKNAIGRDRVAHAYLFTGPRGVGKTTVARILAKALNCQKAPTLQPCGKCSACTEIGRGTSMDVIEIDGASNRGIDEIRNLRESVRYAPVGGKKKVYIIDEVHMLTQEAFNALLKTLEEPPPHVVFVFATTQPLKVPETIVSRCQRFDFRRIGAAEISARLRDICKTEGYACEDSALQVISQRAEGSMRDAESILEQVLAFSGGKATEDEIAPIVGLRGSDLVLKMVDAIGAGDRRTVMELVGESMDGGIDPGDLAAAIMEHIRFMLVASIDAGSRELLSLGEKLREATVKSASALGTEHLLTMLTMLSQSETSIRRSTHQRYVLEAVLLRMASIGSLVNIKDVIATVEKMKGRDGGPVGGSEGGTPRGGSAAGEPPADAKAAGRAGRSGGAGRKKKPARPSSPTAGLGPDTEPVVRGAAAGIHTAWNTVVESLRNTKASLASVLELGELTNPESGVLLLEFDSKFHEDQVRKGKNIQILTDALEKLTNTSVVIKTKVKLDRRKGLEAEDVNDIATREPVVRAIIDRLGGRVRRIRRPRDGGTE